MAAYITAEDMQYLRVVKGFRIRRSVPKDTLANDAHILHCKNELDDGK